jgi:VWFA-related protein
VKDVCFRLTNSLGSRPSRLLSVALALVTSALVLDNSTVVGQDYSSQVSLYVSVVDRQGRPVENLSQERFQVFEDKKQQTISSFRFEKDTPLSLGILIDVSRSMDRERIDMALTWVKSLAERLKSPDEIFINAFSDDSQEVIDFTAPEDYLEEALSHLGTGGQCYTGLAVDRGLIKLRDGKNRKRALLLVSAGLDKAGPATLEHIARFRYPIYGLGLKPTGGVTSTLDRLKSLSVKGTALKVYADQSGGSAVFAESSNEAEHALVSVYYDLKTQYRLEYVSSNSKRDGKLRKIEVIVSGGDYDIRFLRKYQAPRR